MAAVTKPEDTGVPNQLTKVVSSPTIGAFLDKAMSDIEKAMHSAAGKTATKGQATFGMQTFMAISNLKASYTIEDLNTPLDSAGELIKNYITLKMNELVRTITTGEPSELVKVATKINELECLEFTTKVTGITPPFIALGVNPVDPSTSHITKVMVAVSGKFPYGNRAGFATLTVDGQDFPSTVRSTKESLKFEVEISNAIPTLDKRKCTFLNASLKVSYPGTGIWSYVTAKEATHKLLLGMERTSPGAIKVIYATPATTLHRTQTTGPFPANGQERVSYYKPEEGWKITSQKIVFEKAPKPEDFVQASIIQGNQVEYRFVDPQTATVKLVTEETQEVPEKVTSSEVIDTLQWGGKIVFKPQAGEKIKEAFLIDENAKVNELKINGHHPLVQLTSKEGSLEVTATTAEILNAPVVLAPQTTPTSNDSDKKSNIVAT